MKKQLKMNHKNLRNIIENEHYINDKLLKFKIFKMKDS